MRFNGIDYFLKELYNTSMSSIFNKQPDLVNDEMKNGISGRGHSTASTDMFPEMFANKQTLVNTSDRVDYQPDHHNHREEDEEEPPLDDDFDKYKNNKSDKVPPKIYESQHSDHDDKYSSYKSDDNHHYKESETEYAKTTYDQDDPSTWTKDDMEVAKMNMIRKLGELKQQGVKISQNYDMDSDFKTMKFEHDLHHNIKAKKESITWMSNMMIGIVKGVELLNDNSNPFDIKFEQQWSKNVTHNIKDYYSVLGDIFEKYSTPGKKMAPELKLFLMLSGSAVQIQMFKGTSKASRELEEDEGEVRRLRNRNRNRSDDNEEHVELHEGSDQSTMSTGRKNQEALTKQADAEHDVAFKKASDLNHVNNSKQEYLRAMEMAKNGGLNKFNNDLVLTDTAISPRSEDNNVVENKLNKLTEYNKELHKHNVLMKAQHKLQELENEKNTNNTNNTKPPLGRPPRELKKSETIIKTAPTIKTVPKKVSKDTESSASSKASKSSKSSRSSNASKSSNASRSSTASVSSASSSSSVSIRSKKSIEALLSPMMDTKQSTSSSSSSSALSVDSDEIRQSDRELKKTSSNKRSKKSKSEEEITFEAISLGKTSNGSSKRGRPRKNTQMNIQLGK